MALGTTLEELVRMFRAATGQSLSAAAGLNVVESIQYALRLQQEMLYADNDWPHLRITRDEVVQAGQRYYTLPADLNFDKVEKAEFRDAGGIGNWRPVAYGITSANLNAYDSDADQRADPVRAWAPHEEGQYEVWPVPATDGGTLRFTGVLALPPLVQPQDTAVLDDQLIVLFAAADWLLLNKSPLAQKREQQAKALYARIRGNNSKQYVTALQKTSDRGPRQRGVTVRAPGT